jgi:hypothetical protein
MGKPDIFQQATRRARERTKQSPHAIGARYDRKAGRIVVRLSPGIDLSFSPADAEGLEEAIPAQLELIEISPSGLGIHFPKIDADLYIPALLEGFLGSKRWMAARMGAQGGKSRSIRKKAASRANGKLGGRPRKQRAG